MEASLRLRLCRLEEAGIPSAEDVARLAGNDLDLLQEIATSYDGCRTIQGNLFIRRAAAEAVQIAQASG